MTATDWDKRDRVDHHGGKLERRHS